MEMLQSQTFPAGIVRVESEVGISFDAVHELAESTWQVSVCHLAVVGEVKQVNLRTPAYTLRHVVRHHAVWNVQKRFKT